MTREAVAGALAFLREHRRSSDVILADGQTVVRALLEMEDEREFAATTISQVRFEDLTLHFSSQRRSFTFRNREALWSSFEDLIRGLEYDDDARIWVMTIGWQSIKRVVTEPPFDALAEDEWAIDGASVYGFETAAIAAEIERRSRRDGGS